MYLRGNEGTQCRAAVGDGIRRFQGAVAVEDPCGRPIHEGLHSRFQLVSRSKQAATLGGLPVQICGVDGERFSVPACPKKRNVEFHDEDDCERRSWVGVAG